MRITGKNSKITGKLTDFHRNGRLCAFKLTEKTTTRRLEKMNRATETLEQNRIALTRILISRLYLGIIFTSLLFAVVRI